MFDGSRIIKLFAWLHGVHINREQLAALWAAISKLYNGTKANGDLFKWLIENGPAILALIEAFLKLVATPLPVAEAVEQYDGLAEMRELL